MELKLQNLVGGVSPGIGFLLNAPLAARGISCAGPTKASPTKQEAGRSRADQGLSLSSPKQKLIKIGAKVVSLGRYVAFQMAEVAVPGILFADILRPVSELWPPPAVAST